MNRKFPFNPLLCFCFGSGQADAMMDANDKNLQAVQETNELNYKMFQEQNAWNLERRDEEWAYNDPSAQMERYLKAGINPLFALGNINSGNAQQLTSAVPNPMQAPHFEPEYAFNTPQNVANVVGAAQNVVNSAQGFYKLALEHQDVTTRQRAQASQESLNRADVAFKKSQTAGQNFLNNLNLKTADSLIGIKQREYEQLGVAIDNAKKEGKQIDELTLNAQETRKQIVAMTDYTYKQADALIQQVNQGWRRLSIEQQNANTNSFAAQSQSYYEGENLKQRGREFAFNYDRTVQELNNKTNDQILQWYKDQRGWLDNLFGSFGSSVVGTFPGTDTHMINSHFRSIEAAGEVLHQRYVDNPSQENYKSYMEWQNSVDNLPQPPNIPAPSNLQNKTVLNPSESWFNP